MVSTILWIIGGVIAVVALYFIGVAFFTFMTMKKMFGWAKQEATDLPHDVSRLRKEVKNENASEGTETFLKTVFVRWFKRIKD